MSTNKHLADMVVNVARQNIDSNPAFRARTDRAIAEIEAVLHREGLVMLPTDGETITIQNGPTGPREGAVWREVGALGRGPLVYNPPTPTAEEAAMHARMKATVEALMSDLDAATESEVKHWLARYEPARLTLQRHPNGDRAIMLSSSTGYLTPLSTIRMVIDDSEARIVTTRHVAE